MDDTILHSGPRSFLLTYDDRRIVAAYMGVNVLFVEDDHAKRARRDTREDIRR